MDAVIGELGGKDAEPKLDDEGGDVPDGVDGAEVAAKVALVHEPLGHCGELKVKHLGGDLVKSNNTGDGDEVPGLEYQRQTFDGGVEFFLRHLIRCGIGLVVRNGLGHPSGERSQYADDNPDADDQVQPLLIGHLLDPSTKIGATNRTTRNRAQYDETVESLGVLEVHGVVQEGEKSSQHQADVQVAEPVKQPDGQFAGIVYLHGEVDGHGDDKAHAGVCEHLALGQARDQREEQDDQERDDKVHTLGQELGAAAEHFYRAQLKNKHRGDLTQNQI